MDDRNRIERWAPFPLAALLLVALPVRWRVHWVDGPPQDMWGWPLPWSADAYVGSGGREVYLAPLAFDLAVAGLLAWAVVRLVGQAPAKARLVLLVPAWLLGAPLLAWICLVTALLAVFAPSLTQYELWYWIWPVERIEGPLWDWYGGG
ncbi:hypothetical protein GVN21_02365 [Caulobacter sp. SLTY]|uniref:hypothetical protein n=1 Tax=Caulobacter sp. SLTY TaxID=2683262 RepID=UPI00141217AC|nr:hypothetical protein [Caulobacter sp. SLTY]NBB14196.1 hypothetical protein [Caulobacter sp. SLTY]